MLLGYSKKTLYSVFFILPILMLWAFFEYQSSRKPIEETPTTNQQSDICPDLSQIPLNQVKSANVRWLPDGDTIHTEKGAKLRLLHINTPETNAGNNQSAQAFAKKAQEKLSQLIGPSKKIYWLSDFKKKDKHGRDLALVFNQEGLFLNAALAEQGLAHSLIIPPNQTYWQCINQAQQQAYRKRLGIWSNPLKKAGEIRSERGFYAVTGQISKIQNTKKYRWLILDNHLWVGISHENNHYFKQANKQMKVGQTLSLVGYVYDSYKKLRVKLNHPAMLLN